MSSNHLEFVVVLSSLIAHGNHLGTFKNTDAWVPPRDSDVLVWDVTWASGLHKAPHVDLMDLSQDWEFSCLQQRQVVECEELSLFQCQPPNTNFLPVTPVINHIVSYFGKWAIIPKSYKMPFPNWKRRPKCVLVSTTFFPPSTQPKNETLRK